MSLPLPEAQQQQVVLPPLLAPVNTAISVGEAQGPTGDKLVLLHIDAATGTHVFFLAAEVAKQIGAQLREAGKRAESALTLVPKSQLIVPGR